MWNDVIQGHDQHELCLQSVTANVVYVMALCQLYAGSYQLRKTRRIS